MKAFNDLLASVTHFSDYLAVSGGAGFLGDRRAHVWVKPTAKVCTALVA